MPLVRISLREGKSEQYRRAVTGGVHQTMVETIDAPAQDRFQIVSEHSAAYLISDPSYLGLDRGDDIVIVQSQCLLAASHRKRGNSSNPWWRCLPTSWASGLKMR